MEVTKWLKPLDKLRQTARREAVRRKACATHAQANGPSVTFGNKK